MTSRIVTPAEFYTTFRAVAKQRKAEIRDAWMDKSSYTGFCLGEANGLFSAIARRLKLQYCCQYFGIDAVMCERVDATNFRSDYWWAAEQLSVVIEHENEIGNAHQEMNKLSMFNAPLKVLVTYPWVSSAARNLETYADILRKADVFGDFTKLRRHLVIFGYGPEDKVTWESFVYRRGQFVPLEVK